MGLPRTIPSGGAGLDTFSEKAAPRPAAQQKPDRRQATDVTTPKSTPREAPRKQNSTSKSAQKSSERSNPRKYEPEVLPSPTDESEELSEFQEFQRWKRMKEKAVGQGEAPVSKKKSQPRQAEGYVNDAFNVGNSVDSVTDSQTELVTKIDPKTGLAYYAIPKTKMGGDGRPVLEIDINIDDLNGEAEAFMAHLRVAPSKKEREEILRKKAELAKEQKEAKAIADQELESKYGSLEQEVDPFNEKSTKKRGFFNKKAKE